jgi:hypothetical protein
VRCVATISDHLAKFAPRGGYSVRDGGMGAKQSTWLHSSAANFRRDTKYRAIRALPRLTFLSGAVVDDFGALKSPHSTISDFCAQARYGYNSLVVLVSGFR